MKAKEFLDVSSIHGLGHINSHASLGKLFWVWVVVCGFLGAGVLVQQAWADWAANPVSTTIQTHPIAQSRCRADGRLGQQRSLEPPVGYDLCRSTYLTCFNAYLAYSFLRDS